MAEDVMEEIDGRAGDSSEMTFCTANYHKDVLKMMSMMRCHRMLTDVTLIVADEKFEAHKVMLAAASPYFKAMFTGGLREATSSSVTLHDLCPSVMRRLLSFVYSGRIRVSELSVCQLLPAASMLQITDVIKACCSFLENQLSPGNALGIGQFAEQHGCCQLKERANAYILQHFSQVSTEEEFLQLNQKQLTELIRRDELNVREETDVYNALLRWVKYKEDERRPKMHTILSAVRCQFLTPSFLNEQMKNCEVIKKLPACREYLAQIFKELTLHKKVSVRERMPNTPRLIYVAGGYYRNSLATVETFNVDTSQWSTLADLTVPRSGLGAAFVKCIFYAIGGRNNTQGCSFDSDWVDRYEPIRDSWRPCQPMSVARNRVGVGVIDGVIYVVGGSNGTDYYETVETYYPEEDVWRSVRSMSTKRMGAGVAVVNRLLYAIGGFDGEERLNTVERYQPETDSWTQVQSMSVARSGAGVAVIGYIIYVVGGYGSDQRQLNSVEAYDTEKGIWTNLSCLSVPRSALSLAAIDDKIYAIGGYDGQDFVSTVEIFNPVTNEWTMGVPMSSPRSGHASAVSFHYPSSCPSDES